MIKNKRAMAWAFSFLLTLAIIALGFLIFYSSYAIKFSKSVEKIELESSSIQESRTLITLLNSNLEDGKTVGDAIAISKTDKILPKVKRLLDGRNYQLLIDGKTIIESNEEPEGPIIQKAALPTPDITIKQVELRVK